MSVSGNSASTNGKQPPLPRRWLHRVAPQLAADEAVRVWFESDLDERQNYQETLFLFTDHRLAVVTDSSFTAWPHDEVTGLRSREQHGLGSFQILGQKQSLGSWRFTAAQSSAAARFVQAANRDLAAARGESLDVVVTVCPSCGAVLDSGESECASCTTTKPPEAKSLLRLSRFARPHAGLIFLGLALNLAGIAAALAGPYITMRLLGDVLIPAEAGRMATVQEIVPYLLALLAAAVLTWLLSWAKNYVLLWVSEQVAADVRSATYSHLQRLSLEFFGGKRTGDLISRISNDSDRLCNFLSTQLVDFITDVLNIVMTAAIMLFINPTLAIVSLIPFPAIAWLSHIVRTQLRYGYSLMGRAWSDMVSVLADTIPGIRVVKAFAQETREIERFSEANNHVVYANSRVNRVWSFFTPIISLLTEIGLLVIWAYGAWQIVGSTLEVAVLITFVQYISRFYVRLDSMSRMLPATQRAAASTHRIFEILERNPSVAEPVKAIHPGRVNGHIEFKGVRFAYGPREVIKGVDLTIEPGEMIGLVGPSGAGKSTLVNLVCRFFDVASGAIFVDGKDIRSFPIEEYRRNIGIVLQDPFLFYGTIAENIAYGRPDATRSDIIEAAKAAKAHEFILRLPDGYDSLVGERGQALSGGERQRISIARALLTDPRILILDEATSSVDTETEREIQAALDNLTRGRATIAIAHRLSTLRNANRIVVMEQGQITEIGGHEELLERAGTYARLHSVQQADPKAGF
jgi:ATP-binding cassette subfamily B protein